MEYTAAATSTDREAPSRNSPLCLVASLAAVVLWTLAACVDGNAPAGEPGRSGSILGSWRMESGGVCTQSLQLQADGRFLHSVMLAFDEGAALNRMTGTYTGPVLGDSSGRRSVRFGVDAPASDSTIAYCDDWVAAAQHILPFDVLEAATGYAPTSLVWRSVPLADGAVAWVGTDTVLADRLVLARSGDQVIGFPIGASSPAATLFHTMPPALLRAPGSLSQFRLMQLPHQTLRVSGPDAMNLHLLLVVHSAVEVTFAPIDPDGDPICPLVVWDNLALDGGYLEPNPLASPVENPVILNPGDPDGFFLDVGLLDDDRQVTVKGWPISVPAGQTAPCSLAIRARPLASALVEKRLAEPGGEPVRMPIVAGAAHLLAEVSGNPGRLHAVPLERDLPGSSFHLTNRLFQPPGTHWDLLGLRHWEGATAALSVQSANSQPFLSVLGSAGAGMGPYSQGRPPDAGATLPIPGSHAVELSESNRTTRLSISVPDPQLVELSVAEATGVSLRLFDSRGHAHTVASKGVMGASDESGLRIVAALEPGSYVLQVTSGRVPATLSVRAALPSGVGLSDSRLEACLLTSLPDGARPADLRRADCGARGIRTLNGIGAFRRLSYLRLDGNPIADIAPLAEIGDALAVLSLASTPVSDLGILDALPALHALSLSGTELSASTVARLSARAHTLRFLDLRGASGLSQADLDALAVAMPTTRIVWPDGSVSAVP